YQAQRLEAEPRAKLQRPRSTRSKDLTDALRRRAKCSGTGSWIARLRAGVHVVGESASIGDVEDVEHLSKDRELPAILEGEGLGRADVLRTEVVTKTIV